MARTAEEIREGQRLASARWRARNLDKARESSRICVARWRDEDPERSAEVKKKSYVAKPVSRILAAARTRARNAGLPFELTVDDIVIPTHCPILGFALECSGDRNSSPSLDRIRPELGYVKDNVQVISTRANRIKNDSTPEEMRLLADYMSRYIQ